MIAYVVGLLLVAWLPDLLYTPCILACALLVARHRRYRRSALLFGLGALLASSWGIWQLGHRLPDRFARTDIHLAGVVEQLPRQQGRRQTFLLRIRSVDSNEAELQRLRRLRLSLYDKDRVLRAGDRIEAVVRLFPARGLQNPHAFDTERRYLTESIDARGYVRTLERVDGAGPSVSSIRQRIADSIDRHFDTETAVTLKALTLGERSGIGRERWTLLSETGTAHLLVVSGVHVAVMAGLGLMLARGLGFPLMLLGANAVWVRRSGLLLALSLASAYALLAGMGLPVQRALIMVAVFIAGEWWLRPVTAWERWRLALIGVTLLQPLAIIEPGAWLSFGAVALLIWISQQGSARGNRLIQWWRIQGQLFIGMMPLSSLLFNQLGFLAPLVNFVALPAVSLLVVLLPLLLPLSLLGVEWAADSIGWSVDLFWRGIGMARENLGLYLALPQAGLFALFLAVLAAFWWLLPIPARWRWLSACMLMPLLSSRFDPPREGEFVATLFDVGQGMSVLIETAEGRVLYDTGPGYPGGSSVFDYAISPALRARNLKNLEQVVVSHDDSDHSGGLPALLDSYGVETLVVGQPVSGAGSAMNCARQPDMNLGGVRFRYLQASPELLRNDNSHSCVLIVESAACVLVIPGDLEIAGELDLLRRVELPEAHWLVAGHHGSKTSTSEDWLNTLRPKVVLFSRGRFNRFGHPAQAVIDRVERQGALIRDTAMDGALILEAGKECRTTAWRDRKKRYWTAG